MAWLQRRWWLLLALLLVGAGLFALVRTWRGPAVDAVAAQPTILVRSLQFSARVASPTRVEVGSTLTGRVAQVLVDEGALVQAGQALLGLASEEWAAALAQA